MLRMPIILVDKENSVSFDVASDNLSGIDDSRERLATE